MHELRHVHQHQHHPNLAVEYAHNNTTVGYHANHVLDAVEVLTDGGTAATGAAG